MRLSKLDKVVLALAATLPFVLVLCTPFKHVGDLHIFHQWQACLDEYGRDIYVRCVGLKYPPNYPSVGIFASAGVTQFAENSLGLTGDMPFRLFLAAVDAVNLILLVILASMVGFARPALAGASVFLLTCIAGGAFWGQIDSISLVFNLLTTVALIKSWTIQEGWRPKAWLGLGVATFSIFMLIKQLNLFSIEYFAVLFVVSLRWLIVRERLKVIAWLGLFLLEGGLVFLGLDRYFTVPSQFMGSSLAYVWMGGGSPQANLLGERGFNIWMLLGRDGLTSSREPLHLLMSHRLSFDVTPHDAGIVLYVLWMLCLLAAAAGLVWRMIGQNPSKKPAVTPRFIIALFLIHGLSYLAVNVLIAGTHERYMNGGYQYLLLALFGASSQRWIVSARGAAFGALCAFANQCFVAASFVPMPGVLFPFLRIEVQACLHILLLVWMGTIVWSMVRDSAMKRNLPFTPESLWRETSPKGRVVQEAPVLANAKAKAVSSASAE